MVLVEEILFVFFLFNIMIYLISVITRVVYVVLDTQIVIVTVNMFYIITNKRKKETINHITRRPNGERKTNLKKHQQTVIARNNSKI